MDDEADRWARLSFARMLSGVAGLCQAYLLRRLGDRERIALTFWEAADAMRSGGEFHRGLAGA